MDSWIFLSLIYGLMCGTSDLFKKQALKSASVSQTLVIFNFVVLIILVFSGGDYTLNHSDFFFIFLKSFCVFLGWVVGYNVIKHMEISHYSIIMLSKVIFSAVLSVTLLGEVLTLKKIVGFLIISFAIAICNHSNKEKKLKTKYFLLTLFSAFLISLSLFLDKVILKTCSNFTLQFYYTILLIIFLLIYVIIKNERLSFGIIKSNFSIVNLGVVTFVADRLHFIAASHPHSSVVIMTLTRHSSLIVSVLVGSMIFKEKHLAKKLFSVLLIIVGLVVAIM